MRAEILAFMVMCVAGLALAEENALFFRSELAPETEKVVVDESAAVRQSRQAQTDQTVRSILEWIQGRYTGGKKSARDSKSVLSSAASEPSRAYLPANEEGEDEDESNVNINPTNRPRPFQPAPSQISNNVQTSNNGYPYENPQPAFPSGPYPSTSGSSSQSPLYSSPKPSQPSFSTTQRPTQRPERPIFSTQRPTLPDLDVKDGEGQESGEIHDLAHPPHIHAVEVQCAKDMMTINIEFNRQFDGVIYSKGFFANQQCRYVSENSGQTKFSFTVSLDSCGTQFIDQFKDGGQAYLENVLVIQTEAGIQEVWDTVRRVRCLWEGNLNKALTAELTIDMLNQEIITFSGDTAVARLDIQAGRGPFAPAATGLIKIGETMTLVVSVEGDPGFDVQVRDCVARDASSDNIVKLTDERGCILKPKLMGAFQKTRDTGNTGASIIAYAFFQAFKFPDIMDLTLDCNVELCKTDCEMCPDPDQKVEPGRRRRDVTSIDNSTLGEPVRVFRSFRIVATEDFEEPDEAVIINVGHEGVCLSMPGFLLASSIMVSMLIGSCSMTAYMWLKSQRATKNVAY